MQAEHWAVALHLYLVPRDAGAPSRKYTDDYAGVVYYATPRDIALGCARHVLGPDAVDADVTALAVDVCGPMAYEPEQPRRLRYELTVSAVELVHAFWSTRASL